MGNKLALWARPPYWYGKAWDGWYVFLSRTRDSNCAERSNFESALTALGGESKTVKVVRDGHFAYGWYEWIAIHQSNKDAIAKAESILEALDEYPIVNDENYDRMVYDSAVDGADVAIRQSDFIPDWFTDADAYKCAQMLVCDVPYYDEQFWPSDEQVKAAVEKYAKLCKEALDKE